DRGAGAGADHRRVPRGRPPPAHSRHRHQRGERGRRDHRVDRCGRRPPAGPAERGRRPRAGLLRARRHRADRHRREPGAGSHRRRPLPRRGHAPGPQGRQPRHRGQAAPAPGPITTSRGLDPRDYPLVAYGGGGPLPAVAIARELGIPRVIVPPSPSTFSAWGMLATDLRHDLVRTVLEPLEGTNAAWAEARYAEMEREIASILPAVGAATWHRAADLRYLGQEHTVTVALETLADWTQLRARFDAAHRRAYGYAAPEVEVQLLNLRLALVSPLDPPRLPTLTAGDGRAPAAETRKIYSTLTRDLLESRVGGGEPLRAGDTLAGPAAIEEAGTTTLLEPGDVLHVDGNACLVITVAKGA